MIIIKCRYLKRQPGVLLRASSVEKKQVTPFSHRRRSKISDRKGDASPADPKLKARGFLEKNLMSA
jgi:hypothetical protein